MSFQLFIFYLLEVVFYSFVYFKKGHSQQLTLNKGNKVLFRFDIVLIDNRDMSVIKYNFAISLSISWSIFNKKQ